MVLGNNTASDISKFFQNSTSREAASGIWKILKYHKTVLLPNTITGPAIMFIIEAEKFSVTHKRPSFRYGSKNKRRRLHS